MKLDKIAGNDFVADIKQIIDNARHKAYAATSFAMVEAYWLVGKRIVEQEQQGVQRAAYGKEISQTLSNELGSGFSTRNLRDFRQLYLTYSDWHIWHTLCAKLNWSHIRLIMRVAEIEREKLIIKQQLGL